jgi:hypothetical protein
MHFLVMVFGENVVQQLAPFQQTNMGPIDPEYMTKIDYTDEVRELFQAPRKCIRLSDGRHLAPTQARDLEEGLLAGAVKVQLTANEARSHGIGYMTLDDAAEDIGAEREGDRFFIEDNPNSHWDWYEIGGRFSRMLKLLPGRDGFTATNLETTAEMAPAKRIEFVLLGTRPVPEPMPGYCDQAKKGDIDWAGMAAEAGAKAGARWDVVRSWTNGASWQSLAELRAKFPPDEARVQYEAQLTIQMIRKARQASASERFLEIDDAWAGTREDFVAAAKARAGAPHAVIFRGEWLESSASWERDGLACEAEWNEQFEAIMAQVSDETLVTIVDCHT